MIKAPPKKEDLPTNVWSELDNQHLSTYLSYHNPLDKKGRYLPFDELQYRVPKELNLLHVWTIIKSSRKSQSQKLLRLGDKSILSKFFLTPLIQKAISYTDRFATNSSLELMSSKIGENHHFKYLLNDLIEDESISSSQLEGAATTTLIAKRLIKYKRKPRTLDEKMVVGNFMMMKFAWKNRSKPLSIDLIEEIHKIGVKDISDEKYHPGAFRQSNDVVVSDRDGEVLHYPPKYKGISTRLERLCEWINQSHEQDDSSVYLHPLVKAIVLHFVIGYDHPFNDGNGRVARTLFYWYLFKHDYGAFRYIAISTLLKKAPSQYASSYIYSEQDELDLTYFIDYQCSIIIRAISTFNLAFENALKEEEEFNRWLWNSGLFKKLNEKQRIVFQVARKGETKDFTISDVKTNLNCSYNTASTVLNELVKLGFFEKSKSGREWKFSIVPKKKLMQSWE